MLTALLGDGAELDPLKRLIIERTGGNPFFIEEMVQALFDEGALVRNGAVKVTSSLSQMRLPPTVQGMLASRIDRLPADAEGTLQTMAVIGRESPLALIRQGRHTSKTIDLDRMVADLQLREFIYEQRAGRHRVRLQARTDPGGRLQLITDRAPQTPARTRGTSTGIDLSRPAGRSCERVGASLPPQRQPRQGRRISRPRRPASAPTLRACRCH